MTTFLARALQYDHCESLFVAEVMMQVYTPTLFRVAVAAALMLISAGSCYAQVEGDLVDKTGPRPASLGAMIGGKLHDQKATFAIDDAVLDLEAGRVVAWLLSSGDHQVVAPREAVMAPPAGSPLQLTGAAAEKVSRFPPAHEQVDRLHVLEAKRMIDAARSEAVEVDVDRPVGPLVRYSACVERDVLDRDNQRFGSLIDFAVRRDGVVQYAVVRKGDASESELLAIPLGAFVLGNENQVWQIELPDDLIVKRSPIEAAPASWPVDVGQGWEEFVRIKYGRALRGVRHLSANE